MKSGTMYGIHAEQASQAVPLMRKYKAAGVQVACVIAVENPGLCVDAKSIDSNILTIARWLHPNGKWERGHDVFNWPHDERVAYVRSAIQMIFDRTNDVEYQACDYFCPGINEPDPPELNGDGYKALAEVMMMLCEEATARSPEMVARGMHPIRLAIPGFNRGTPEWVEMRAMRDTGLFTLMKQRGDILMTHEGVGLDEPANHGHGDLIPGAPFVPPNAGSLSGRINYFYALGLEIPFVVTEWYDGMWRTTDPVVRLEAMKWYDRLMRRNKWFRGFCPFELTDVEGGQWHAWDFTPTFQTNEMLADMIAQKNVANPLGVPEEEDDMDEPTRLALIADMDSAAQKINRARGVLISLAPAPVPAALFRVRIIVDALNVRSGPGPTHPDIGDVTRDTILGVYEVSQPSGWFRIEPASQKWISGAAQYSVRV